MSDEDNKMGSCQQRRIEVLRNPTQIPKSWCGSTEMADFPKDTELELDSVGTIVLEGGTSSSGVIERAVDELPGDTVGISDLRDCHRENIRSARKIKT